MPGKKQTKKERPLFSNHDYNHHDIPLPENYEQQQQSLPDYYYYGQPTEDGTVSAQPFLIFEPTETQTPYFHLPQIVPPQSYRSEPPPQVYNPYFGPTALPNLVPAPAHVPFPAAATQYFYPPAPYYYPLPPAPYYSPSWPYNYDDDRLSHVERRERTSDYHPHPSMQNSFDRRHHVNRHWPKRMWYH